MIGFANAKINIGLQIVGKRQDGYHLINTVFYPIRLLRDVIEILPNSYFDLIVTGLHLDIPVEQNLVFRAYQLLKADFNLPQVTIFLHKVIPYGAGLGGGSSDAAVVLKLLNQMFDLNLSENSLMDYARKLGADCAFFIKNKPVYATGIGDQFQDIDLFLDLFNIVIVKPDFSISTKEAYSLVKPQKPDFDLLEIEMISPYRWLDCVKNDFELFLFDKYPLLRQIKQQLYQLGALYASLSGSGSAVYGIFDFPVDLSVFSAYPFVWQSADII